MENLLEAISFLEENWEPFVLALMDRGLDRETAEAEAERVVDVMRNA